MRRTLQLVPVLVAAFWIAVGLAPWLSAQTAPARLHTPAPHGRASTAASKTAASKTVPSRIKPTKAVVAKTARGRDSHGVKRASGSETPCARTRAKGRSGCGTASSGRATGMLHAGMQHQTRPGQALTPRSARPSTRRANLRTGRSRLQPADPIRPQAPSSYSRQIASRIEVDIPADVVAPPPIRSMRPPALAMTPLPTSTPALTLAPRPVIASTRNAVMPPPMRGSLLSLERQNAMADAEGLERIEDEADLSDRIAEGLLVPVPVSASLSVNGNLPEHHRYCRPWTARFLADLSRAFGDQFRASFEVSSAVRTVAYQKRLMGVNGNAAPAVGDIVSPHLTGATIDIAKSGLTRAEIGWMRAWLLPLQTAGKLDVEEEFQQSCFHITVYKVYVPARPATSVARARMPQAVQPLGRPAPSDLAAGAPALGR